MALPYPSMSFVPLDILTAEEMNQMVANDQYLDSKFPIQTSDLGNGSITVDKVDSSSFMVAKPLMTTDIPDNGTKTVTLTKSLFQFYLFVNSHINHNEIFFITAYGAAIRVTPILESGGSVNTTFSYDESTGALTITAADNCRGQLYRVNMPFLAS